MPGENQVMDCEVCGKKMKTIQDTRGNWILNCEWCNKTKEEWETENH